MKATGTLEASFLGFFNRKERWGLSLRGWALLFFIFAIAFSLLLWTVHSFLAVNRPILSDYLVVEGWIPGYAVKRCAEIFTQDGYKKIITIGDPVRAVNYPAADDDTYAYVAAEQVRSVGVDPKAIAMVPNSLRMRDIQTYASAVTVRKWLYEHGFFPSAITVATLGPHARRTRLLYEKAFGSNVKIGIIAIDNRDYDSMHWWRYSEGVKEVISEGSAYIYARFFYHPHETND